MTTTIGQLIRTLSQFSPDTPIMVEGADDVGVRSDWAPGEGPELPRHCERVVLIQWHPE